jgi:hypothetical protein
LDWFPEDGYWSGLDEAPSGARKYYRTALGNIYGDSPFAQPPLKVVEVGLQVADKQRPALYATKSESHYGSHACQICQLTNGRAGWPAEIRIKGGSPGCEHSY